MNHDDVIRMAREAGYQPLNPDAIFDCLQEVFFERFAELVKQHIQIEQMAKFEELANIVRSDERERCATVCEQRAIAYKNETDLWAHEHIAEAKYLAAAIRESRNERTN